MSPEEQAPAPDNRPPEEKDTFTFHVMRRIPDEVRSALTEEQLGAFRKAVYESRPGQGHALDARINFPLFFAKFYLVLQLGRDRRSSTRNAEDQRRRAANHIFDRVVLGILIFNVVQIAFLILYALKSFLGINLFPHDHLIDFLPDF